MSNLFLKSSKRAERYFGLGARQSALFLDNCLTVAENKDRFGRSYDRATMWYSLIHNIPVKRFTADDYDDCYNKWQIMNALTDMVTVVEDDSHSFEELSLEDRFIDRTFAVMQKLFNGTNVIAETDEDKKSYILSCLNLFKAQTQTEVLHKASCKVLKMSYDDLFAYGESFAFDSRKASDSDTGMRWILTSEDGISRLLADCGKEQVILNLNTADKETSDEEKEKLLAVKETIFEKGIVDIATNKKYLSSAPSASSTRHVDFPFINVSEPEEVYKIWCDITGFKDIESLAKGIGKSKDDGIYVVFAKLKARIAQNGANSLSMNYASDRVRNWLRNARVDFTDDCHGEIYKPCKKVSAVGVLSFTTADGTIDERV